jgi:glycerate kinase
MALHRNILIAPYAFKGTLTASEAAAAIAEGIARLDGSSTTTSLPLGDGGSGTLDALIRGLDGEYRDLLCTDAIGRERCCRWGLASTGEGIVEAAEAIGLADVPENLRDPAMLGTVGLGNLILAALEASPTGIIIGLGDTATHDCGLGVGWTLGYRFYDRRGDELPPVGRSLPHLACIDASRARTITASCTIYCDVMNFLLGDDGAALRFAGQKGADAQTIALLEAGGERFAEIVARDLGIDVTAMPGGGAAGGLGAGLAAFLGATLTGGADGVLDAIGFDKHLSHADLVITGEGSLDHKTLLGKGVGHVARRVTHAGKDLLVAAGRVEGEPGDWERKLGGRVIVAGIEGALKGF